MNRVWIIEAYFKSRGGEWGTAHFSGVQWAHTNHREAQQAVRDLRTKLIVPVYPWWTKKKFRIRAYSAVEDMTEE